MKKISLLLFILFMLFISSVSSIQADIDTIDGVSMGSWDGVDISGGGCTTLTDSQTATEGQREIGAAATLYYANKIVAGSTHDVCKVELLLQINGSPTGNIDFQLWSHNAGGDEPDAVLTNGTSEVKANSTMPSSESYEAFSFSTSPSLTNATTYWIVAHCTANSTVNNVFWNRGDPGGTERILISADGSTWSLDSATRSMTYKLYKE